VVDGMRKMMRTWKSCSYCES